MTQKKLKDLRIPKHSYRRGFTDEGISSVLEKPPGFRYSDRFLKEWYTREG